MDLPNNPVTSHLYLDRCLEQLRMGYTKRGERFSVPDGHFFNELSTYLYSLVENRLMHVSKWLTANTQRFGERGEIAGLVRTFDAYSKELRASVALCGSKCSSCGLLCLEHKQHMGKHDCKTTHKCAFPCEFLDQHEDAGIPECDIPLVLSLCSRFIANCSTGPDMRVVMCMYPFTI
jgi:hypothetical protein